MVKEVHNPVCLFYFVEVVMQRLSGDTPLFWFELDVIYYYGRCWLVEYCVFWNGVVQIMEMVEIKGSLNGYIQEIE